MVSENVPVFVLRWKSKEANTSIVNVSVLRKGMLIFTNTLLHLRLGGEDSTEDDSYTLN